MAIDDENESAIRPRRRSLDRYELFPHSFELVRVRNFVQRRFISVIGDVWDVHFVLVRIGVFATQVGVDHREQVASVMCEFVCVYVHVIILIEIKMYCCFKSSCDCSLFVALSV